MIVGDLCHQFRDAPPNQVRQDVERLLSDFRGKGLARITETNAGWPSNRRPITRLILPATWAGSVLVKLRLDTLAALFGMAAVTLILKTSGFATLLQAVKNWPVRVQRIGVTTEGRVCAAVDTATTWFPKQALCLQRSAVTACLLRLHGIDGQMVIGCRKIPFKAHAWVEVNGLVTNDKRQVQEFYTVLVRC